MRGWRTAPANISPTDFGLQTGAGAAPGGRWPVKARSAACSGSPPSLSRWRHGFEPRWGCQQRAGQTSMGPWRGAPVEYEILGCRPGERRCLLVLLVSPKVRLASGPAGTLDCCSEHECQSLSDRHEAPRDGTPLSTTERVMADGSGGGPHRRAGRFSFQPGSDPRSSPVSAFHRPGPRCSSATWSK